MHLASYNRYQASFTHFLLSAALIGLVASVVFMVWYPGPLAYASAVGSIFLVLVLVDVVFGPVITLIIFNPAKSELKRDLVCVLVIQLLALAYGLATLFSARPVYVVFNMDGFYTVYANEISNENLQLASVEEFRSLPLARPRVVGAAMPQDPELATQVVYKNVMSGEDIQHMPQYYLHYDDVKQQVAEKARPLEQLRDSNVDRELEVEQLIEQFDSDGDSIGYLPVFAKAHHITALVNRSTGEVLRYMDFAP